MAKIQSSNKISPCLWYDRNAEEAVKFYLSVFKNAKRRRVSYYAEGMHLPAGTVLTVSFTIGDQEFLALNGGPVFHFSEAVSFVVRCKNQKEIDYYWDKLSKGGEKSQCGWLKDKFGLSWQVVPDFLDEMAADKDPKKVARVFEALLRMRKLDSGILKKAYSGKK
jgi:predicted 3-demethylubiquinone-9 3-methyltransferase (glyoxalase superfamily)